MTLPVLLGTAERRLRRKAVTPRPLAFGIVGLVLGMVVIVAAGFAFINTQQETLRGLREEGEAIRIAGDALVAADIDVTHMVLGDTNIIARDTFYRTIAVLKEQRHTLIALLSPDLPDGGSALDAVDTLQAAWTEAIDLVTSGRRAEAQAMLSERGTGALVSAMRKAVDLFLDQWNLRSSIYEDRIAMGTWLVLLLQVGSGALAISGLVYAFRSTASEAGARAMAVANADAAREKVGRLFEMADVLQSAGDLTDANAVLKATASDLVPGVGGALYVFNNSRDRLVLSTSWQHDAEHRRPETISPQTCWAIKRGKPHVSNGEPGNLCCEHHDHGSTVLEIPMIARGEILGLLQFHAAGVDAAERLAAITGIGSALADGMSLALANIGLREKLSNQALRDPLTGLYNRRYMEDTLQRFVRLAERENRALSVIMIDLDHFKRLNDEHGHAMGDAVLRDTAAAIVSSLRETDVACRYGGEELIVILPDCDIDKAAEKAEVLRARIEDLTATHAAAISASFGVASIPHTSLTTVDLVNAADAALYRSKQDGRNRVSKAPRRPARGERAKEAAASTETVVALEAAE